MSERGSASSACEIGLKENDVSLRIKKNTTIVTKAASKYIFLNRWVAIPPKISIIMPFSLLRNTADR